MASAWHRLGPLQMVAIIIAMAAERRKIFKCYGKSKNKEENHIQSHGYTIWTASVRKILRKGPAKTVPNLESVEIGLKPDKCETSSSLPDLPGWSFLCSTIALFIPLVFVELNSIILS